MDNYFDILEAYQFGEYLKFEGGKKVRPYLEVKVVKVRKPHTKVIKFTGSKYVVFIKDGKVSIKIHQHQAENKDNYVNGENLDKIEFPCFCRFDARNGMFPHKEAVRGIGMINKIFENQILYQLTWLDRQTENLSSLCSTPSLKRLIEIYDIKILKGKIIIYEEE